MFPCSHENISFQQNEKKWMKKKGSEGNIENLFGGGGKKGREYPIIDMESFKTNWNLKN